MLIRGAMNFKFFQTVGYELASITDDTLYQKKSLRNRLVLKIERFVRKFFFYFIFIFY